MVDDAERLGDDDGGCLPPIPCATRLAPVGPWSSSAKHQDSVTRAVLQVNSGTNHDSGYSA